MRNQAAWPQADSPREISRLVARHLENGDLEGVVSLFDPECRIFFPPGEPPKLGLDGARSAFAEVIGQRPSLISEIKAEIITGDVALLQAAWRLESSDRTLLASGRSMEVARRSADGGWRYLIDCPGGLPDTD
ncbi:MAG: nuclear transport factor 2 family protein [Acidobacteriota bacterium]